MTNMNWNLNFWDDDSIGEGEVYAAENRIAKFCEALELHRTPDNFTDYMDYILYNIRLSAHESGQRFPKNDNCDDDISAVVLTAVNNVSAFMLQSFSDRKEDLVDMGREIYDWLVDAKLLGDTKDLYNFLVYTSMFAHHSSRHSKYYTVVENIRRAIRRDSLVCPKCGVKVVWTTKSAYNLFNIAKCPQCDSDYVLR